MKGSYGSSRSLRKVREDLDPARGEQCPQPSIVYAGASASPRCYAPKFDPQRLPQLEMDSTWPLFPPLTPSPIQRLSGLAECWEREASALWVRNWPCMEERSEDAGVKTSILHMSPHWRPSGLFHCSTEELWGGLRAGHLLAVPPCPLSTLLQRLTWRTCIKLLPHLPTVGFSQ